VTDAKYSREISRATPGCIIFLLDHSYSMLEGIAGSKRAKREAMSTAINRILSDIVASCERGADKPYNYFDIGVIGYTTDKQGVPIIGPALEGMLAGRDLVTIEELFDHPLVIEKRKKMVDDGTGGLIETEVDFPVWYKGPTDDRMAGTPMSGALNYCHRVASEWSMIHPDSLPPIVIHLTDGESTDEGDPELAAEALRAVETGDGNLLLFNCHLSKSEAASKLFPVYESELPDDYARMLFRMSSLLPKKFVDMAETKQLGVPDGSRGMAFNADMVGLIKLLNVGTQVATAPPPSHLV